jgi:hypothetical protein
MEIKFIHPFLWKFNNLKFKGKLETSKFFLTLHAHHLNALLFLPTEIE